MMSPFPEHGPMSAFKVVDAVMVLPHTIVVVAEADAGKKTRVEPRIVARRRITLKIFISFHLDTKEMLGVSFHFRNSSGD
jgi:hypothetical protein